MQDEKELAEHNMLVDLGRNDIGKISRIGTVKVEKYMEIERFSHVMHIGSTVTGTIREDKDAVDAVDAILRQGLFREHRSSERARSSTSWKTTSEACTAEPSATWTLQEIWTPALPSAWYIKRTGRSASDPVRGS